MDDAHTWSNGFVFWLSHFRTHRKRMVTSLLIWPFRRHRFWPYERCSLFSYYHVFTLGIHNALFSTNRSIIGIRCFILFSLSFLVLYTSNSLLFHTTILRFSALSSTFLVISTRPSFSVHRVRGIRKRHTLCTVLRKSIGPTVWR